MDQNQPQEHTTKTETVEQTSEKVGYPDRAEELRTVPEAVEETTTTETTTVSDRAPDSPPVEA